MPKTRGRKRHARKTRRHCTRGTRRIMRRTRRNTRMRGGRSNTPTYRKVDGEDVTRDAVIITSDGFSGGVNAVEQHFAYRDFQGPEQ